MSGGILSSGGYCPRWDIVLGGDCSGGDCPGGYCPGGYCPRTSLQSLDFCFQKQTFPHSSMPVPL